MTISGTLYSRLRCTIYAIILHKCCLLCALARAGASADFVDRLRKLGFVLEKVRLKVILTFCATFVKKFFFFWQKLYKISKPPQGRTFSSSFDGFFHFWLKCHFEFWAWKFGKPNFQFFFFFFTRPIRAICPRWFASSPDSLGQWTVAELKLGREIEAFSHFWGKWSIFGQKCSKTGYFGGDL